MATLTITTTSGQDTRILSAFGKQLNTMTTDDPPVSRNATPSEVRAAVIEFLKVTVKRHEDRAAAQAAVDAVTEIDPI